MSRVGEGHAETESDADWLLRARIEDFSDGGSVGTLYFISPTVALEGGASFTPGRLMESDLGGVSENIGVGVAGVRMHVGLTFYPFR